MDCVNKGQGSRSPKQQWALDLFTIITKELENGIQHDLPNNALVAFLL